MVCSFLFASGLPWVRQSIIQCNMISSGFFGVFFIPTLIVLRTITQRLACTSYIHQILIILQNSVWQYASNSQFVCICIKPGRKRCCLCLLLWGEESSQERTLESGDTRTQPVRFINYGAIELFLCCNIALSPDVACLELLMNVILALASRHALNVWGRGCQNATHRVTHVVN